LEDLSQPILERQLPSFKVIHSLLFFVMMIFINIFISILFGIFAGIYAMVIRGLSINEIMVFILNLMTNGNIIILLTLIYYLLVILFMVLFLQYKQLDVYDIFAFKKVVNYHWSLLLLLSIILIGLAIVISMAFKELSTKTFMYQIVTSGKGLITLCLFMILGAPIIEETVFRGFLYYPFEKKWGNWPAILIITGIFSFFHIFQLLGSMVLLIPIIALGLVTGWLRGNFHSILPGFIVHTIYNTVLILISLYEMIRGLD
jgi:membrane protease YdiL (CAAX protease family)